MSDRLTRLSVIAFIGPETLPLLVGEEQGFYADEGLTVACEPAPGSVYQMTRLIEGDCDLAMTAIDNVIAYDAGQGAAETKVTADLVAVLGSASEPRPLVAVAGFETVETLRGKRIAVDALNTGFSFLLRQLLEDHGLGLEDYELVPVGAPPARYEAMQKGECAAALLSKAVAAVAVAEGCTELRTEPDPWARYQGGVYCAQRGWVAANRTPLAGFIRSTLHAVEWIRDPVNAPSLADLLMRHLPHMRRRAAEAAARELHSPQSLLRPGLPIDRDGLETVLALRAKYGTPPAALGRAETYLDLSVYDEVVRP